MTAKKRFLFTINYFKDTGKWYSSSTGLFECQILANDPTQPYVQDAVDTIKEMRERNVPHPGLSSAWKDGYITIQFEDSYPTLILPMKQEIS